MRNFDNEFLMKIANSTSRRGSGEAIQLLGKQAAGRYINKEAPDLGKAVRDVVAQNPELKPDQVRRVAEAANQAAWHELFHKGGDASTHFEPASGESVLESMRPKADEVQASNAVHADFTREPPAQAELGLDELASSFGVSLEDKTPDPALNPAGEAERQHAKVAAANQVIGNWYNKLIVPLTKAEEGFGLQVKQAHLQEGVGIGQIASALRLVADDPRFAVMALQEAVSTHLGGQGQFSMQEEQEKMAEHVTVDHQHPLMLSYKALEKLAAEKERLGKGAKKMAWAEKRSRKALKDKMRGC